MVCKLVLLGCDQLWGMNIFAPGTAVAAVMSAEGNPMDGRTASLI
jgi:hypothetical protein